jgi:type VI secretion system protein ImpA
MSGTIDLQAILAPIPGDFPAGVDLRYDPVYEEIKEARRAEDPLATGGVEPKRSDWEKVGSLSANALATKTKDLQIAAWLTEALIHTEGFEGFAAGLRVLTRLLETYWDTLHPAVEEEDLESRVGPLEFLNEALGGRETIPVTDPGFPTATRCSSTRSRTADIREGHPEPARDVDEESGQRKETIAEEALVGPSIPRWKSSRHSTVPARGGDGLSWAFDAFEAVDARSGKRTASPGRTAEGHRRMRAVREVPGGGETEERAVSHRP